MQRIGEPIAKAAVYVLAFAFWAIAMLLTFNLAGLILKGHIERYWSTLVIIMFGFAAFFAVLSRQFIKFGIPKAVSLFRRIPPGCADEANAKPLAIKESAAMSKNDKILINVPGDVTIHAPTNHNVAGGIIGNGPVTIHQHFGERSAERPAPRNEAPANVPEVAADNGTIDINELSAFADRFKGRPVSRGTIVNILERAGITPCGEVKVDKAWCNVYPRARSKEAVEQWVNDKKK